MDDAYISQANVIITEEGMILQSTSSLGSCKFNGEGYMCQSLLLTHPSHHTIEDIQADAEVVAIFTNPTGKMLCVSSLVRVNPHQNNSTHFFNSFVPYGNPSVASTPVNLGENWSLSMMVPPTGSHFVYDGSLVLPPCSPTTWVVFKAMINIDSNDFALLVKNVVPGSRPIQALGDREVFFNDITQLPGVPFPHDNKTYMRCKRVPRKGEDVKPVVTAPLREQKALQESPNAISKWVSGEIHKNGILALLDVILMILAFGFGTYYAWRMGGDPKSLFLISAFQSGGLSLRDTWPFSMFFGSWFSTFKSPLSSTPT
jgi:carbonic anhydrase